MFCSCAAQPPAAGRRRCDSLQCAEQQDAPLAEAWGFSVPEGKLQNTVRPAAVGCYGFGLKPLVIRSICHNLGRVCVSSANFRSILCVHLYNFYNQIIS